jgi:hypothetical protein
MSNYIIKIIISNKIITYSFWLRESFEIPLLPVNFVENNQTIMKLTIYSVMNINQNNINL